MAVERKFSLKNGDFLITGSQTLIANSRINKIFRFFSLIKLRLFEHSNLKIIDSFEIIELCPIYHCHKVPSFLLVTTTVGEKVNKVLFIIIDGPFKMIYF